jgi:hypothetical protein
MYIVGNSNDINSNLVDESNELLSATEALKLKMKRGRLRAERTDALNTITADTNSDGPTNNDINKASDYSNVKEGVKKGNDGKEDRHDRQNTEGGGVEWRGINTYIYMCMYICI